MSLLSRFWILNLRIVFKIACQHTAYVCIQIFFDKGIKVLQDFF